VEKEHWVSTVLPGSRLSYYLERLRLIGVSKDLEVPQCTLSSMFLGSFLGTIRFTDALHNGGCECIHMDSHLASEQGLKVNDNERIHLILIDNIRAH
jgi:hypothetical protein